MDDEIGLGHLFQRRAERGDEMGRQVGDEPDRVGQDRRLRPTAASSRRIVGSSVANSRSSARHRAPGQPVEQRRFAGVGVADQRHHRIRHALARLAMQRAGALHAFELALELARCARRSGGGRFRAGFRRGRRGSRSRRAGARDGSRTAPAASADRSAPPVRPAGGLHGCARARRRSRGSGRCGR